MKKRILLPALLIICGLVAVKAQTTSPSPYCIAYFDDPFGNVPDAIASVALGTMTHITNSQYAFPHYVFYNNVSAPNLAKGSTYTLTVVFDVNGGCGYGVWIDYNHDNMFDLTEKISANPVGINMPFPTATITQSITIPTTAVTGITRMRVRIVEDDQHNFNTGYVEDPCDSSTSATDVMDWGETEDYNLNITGTTGINEINEMADLSVFPNPASTILSFNTVPLSVVNYKIINLLGKEIAGGIINSDNTIDIASLPEGCYFLQLFDNEKQLKTQKFIKISS